MPKRSRERLTPGRHECAAEGCAESVPSRFLMCRAHWYRVPQPLRNEVWRAYRHEGVLSEAYVDAVEAAVESLR